MASGATPGGESLERCRRLASALTARGIGRGDTVAMMAPNMPEAFEAHFGVPMAGAVLNALNIRLDAETIAFILQPRRGQGAAHRHRILAGRRPRAGACSTTSRWSSTSPIRKDRAASASARSITKRFSPRGDPDFAGADARRRMGRDRAQLHLGHHRQPEGRRLSPPRRLSERARQHPRLGHAAAPGLSLDLADVPLQRLVLPVDGHGAGRDPCLPAPGRGRAIYDAIERARRHPSVRRADRHEHAAQRPAELRALAARRSR